MSTCSNCFNGCISITSDQCVKYTGVDIPVLGIQNGDSLSYVEQALIDFLVSTLNGTGIIPDTSNINTSPTGISCTLVQQYLPTCGNITIVDIFTALIQASCNLQGQVDDITEDITVINDTLTELNAPYTISCLSGVTINSDTHDVLQAVITALCALVASLPTTYVALDDLNTLIDAHLEDTSTLVCNKMVPWVAVPFFDPDLTGKFDGTGAGIGDWLNIYLCNGDNGTPDLRGRVPVGLTDGTMHGGVMDAEVNPASDPTFNKIYTLNLPWGSNKNTLLAAQMPIHTHTNVVTETAHYHYLFNVDNDGEISLTNSNYSMVSDDTEGEFSYEIYGSNTIPTLGRSSSSLTNPVVTIATTGSGLPHSNIQPVIGCYYIIYIP